MTNFQIFFSITLKQKTKTKIQIIYKLMKKILEIFLKMKIKFLLTEKAISKIRKMMIIIIRFNILQIKNN